jgi:hypothetical protein
VNSIIEKKNEKLTAKVDQLLNIMKDKEDTQVNAINQY